MDEQRLSETKAVVSWELAVELVGEIERLQTELDLQPARQECLWKCEETAYLDYGTGDFISSCGNTMQLEMVPLDMGFSFCPFCGRKLIEAKESDNG